MEGIPFKFAQRTERLEAIAYEIRRLPTLPQTATTTVSKAGLTAWVSLPSHRTPLGNKYTAVLLRYCAVIFLSTASTLPNMSNTNLEEAASVAAEYIYSK